MKRAALLGLVLPVIAACGAGSLSDAQREWCADNYLTVYRTGQELELDMREWTENTEWPLATRPEYIRACRSAFEAR